jgi:exonuclease VII large subunit
MSIYPDLDDEERMTPEQRARRSAEEMDRLIHFTPEEKARREAAVHRDILMDIQLEAERIERAEKEIRAAAYQKAKARKKARREALEAGLSPEALDYYKRLEQALRLIPKTPPTQIMEKGFIKIKAIALVILDRLAGFTA